MGAYAGLVTVPKSIQGEGLRLLGATTFVKLIAVRTSPRQDAVPTTWRERRRILR